MTYYNNIQTNRCGIVKTKIIQLLLLLCAKIGVAIDAFISIRQNIGQILYIILEYKTKTKSRLNIIYIQ